MTTHSSSAISRRGFFAGAAATGTLAALGFSGCAPKTEDKAAAAQTASASATPAWLGEAPDISHIDETVDCEVLVVGAGCSGMPAAAQAAQLGLDLVVCEKSNHVGDTHFDIGAINSRFTPTDHLVNKGRLLNEMNRYASFKNDSEVTKVWIDESAGTIDWLLDVFKDQDLTFQVDEENGSDFRAGGTDYYIPYQMHRMMPKDPTKMPWIMHNELFKDYIEKAGYEISFNHDLVKLVREEGDGGRVTGAIFKTKNGYKQVNASKGIVLACGGYAGNPDMVKGINPIVPKCVTTCGYNQNNTGAGIKAGMWIGAAKDVDPAAMIFDRGGVEPGVDAGYIQDGKNLVFPGHIQQLGIGSMPFLKVDRRGERITNESANYDAICHASAQRPGGVWCEVFDVNAPEDVQRFKTQGCSNMVWKSTLNGHSIDEAYAAEIEAGVIKKADTLDELADMLGFEGDDKKTFLASIERYNDLYDKQEDEDFGKEAYRLSAIRQAPFYGAWFGGSLLNTLDGLRINKYMQVLDTESNVIPGLYAAGTTSGSFYSGNYPVYIVGNCMGRNITFGRRAVLHIAGEIDE